MASDLPFDFISGSKYAESLSSILPGRLKSESSLGKTFSVK